MTKDHWIAALSTIYRVNRNDAAKLFEEKLINGEIVEA